MIMRGSGGGMSCLSEVLSQTRDSLRPWVREGEGQGKAGGRPPEYCAGYCRPAPPLAKVQLFSPKLGADTYYRAPPHSPRLALLSTTPHPMPQNPTTGQSVRHFRSTLFSFKRKYRRSVDIVRMWGTNWCYLVAL